MTHLPASTPAHPPPCPLSSLTQQPKRSVLNMADHIHSLLRTLGLLPSHPENTQSPRHSLKALYHLAPLLPTSVFYSPPLASSTLAAPASCLFLEHGRHSGPQDLCFCCSSFLEPLSPVFTWLTPSCNAAFSVGTFLTTQCQITTHIHSSHLLSFIFLYHILT